MKTFQEFLIESLDKPICEAQENKKYDFTDQEYQDWVDLKDDSKIVKKIEDFIEAEHDAAKETAYCEYNDNAENEDGSVRYDRVGGPYATYDVLGDLEMDMVTEWWKDTEVEHFHTEYILKKGKDGLQSILDYIKKMYDVLDGRDCEKAPGEAVYEYYKVCQGLSDAEYKRKVYYMSAAACKKEYCEWKSGV